MGRPARAPARGARLVLGIATAVLALASLGVGFGLSIPHGIPTRAGLARSEAGDLVVHIALCPGEQVTRIVVENEFDEPGDLLWVVQGPGSDQTVWTVGGPLPPGFLLLSRSTDVRGPTGRVRVEVTTTGNLDSTSYAGQAGLSRPGVWFQGRSVAASEFEATAKRAYSCSDPWKNHRRLVIWSIVVPTFLACVALAVVMLHTWRIKPPPGY